MLKGILDSRRESTVAEISRLGRIVSDKGRETTISSVLNSIKKSIKQEKWMHSSRMMVLAKYFLRINSASLTMIKL